MKSHHEKIERARTHLAVMRRRAMKRGRLERSDIGALNAAISYLAPPTEKRHPKTQEA